MTSSATTEHYPSWLGRKVLTSVASAAAVALMFGAFTTLGMVLRASEIAQENQKKLEDRAVWMERQSKTTKILSENQRLIICQIKSESGSPCLASDLFIEHP